MRSRSCSPRALTIAGSDSGGGAGIQADLRTFGALGVHGVTAITCITAQNRDRVAAIEPCNQRMLTAQLEAIFEEGTPAAAKTGMLFSAPLVRVVARFFKRRNSPLLIVDPVMISTSGCRLLRRDALDALKRELLPLAALVTPNIPETEVLLKKKIRNPEDMRAAARTLCEAFGAAILVKGGHLQGADQAIDIFWDGREEFLLSAPLLRGVRTHGTGCTYSAAIAAYIARGSSLRQAVVSAKTFVTETIASEAL